YGEPCGSWKQVYYGRGLVQLTWWANYARADARLHDLGALDPDQDLEMTPDLALDPNIAAAILIFGMTEGWFTDRKLSDYFTATTTDFIQARRIVNGLDRA